MTGLWALIDTKTMWGGEWPAMVALDELERFLSMTGDDIRPVVFAIERFDITRFTAKASRQPDAIEVTGAIKWLAHKLGDHGSVVMQGRDVKSRVPNHVLHRLEWWIPGSEGHTHDAQRHAVVCAAKLTPWHEVVQRAFGTVE